MNSYIHILPHIRKDMGQNSLHITQDGKTAICGQVSTIYGIKTTSNLKIGSIERFSVVNKSGDIPRCSKCAKIEKIPMPQAPKIEAHYKIPFNMKHLAKKCGMWWNKDSKTWFIPAHKMRSYSPISSINKLEKYFAYEKEVV